MEDPVTRRMLRQALAVCLIAACSKPASNIAPVAVVACSEPGVGSTSLPWRQVRASGFTFCVPGDWRAAGASRSGSDANRWSGNGASLAWDLGRVASLVPNEQLEAEGYIVTVGPGGGSVASVPARPPSVDPAQPCPPATNTPHLVGNVALFVTQAHCQGVWVTTAWSIQPAMYVQGQARTPEAAEVLRSIMATLHFTTPGPSR